VIIVVLVSALGAVLGTAFAHSGAPRPRASSAIPTAASSGALSLAQIEARLRNLPPAPTVPAPVSSAPTTLPATPPTSAAPVTSRPTTPPTTAASSGSAAYMNGVQAYAVGQTGTLWDPTKMVAVATIAVSPPQFATSDGSGHVARYGYFATFTVTVTDIAPAASADTISPSDVDFYVMVDGSRYGFGQPNVGNTAQAEGDNSLGTGVEGDGLTPGQSTTGTVTVDVPSLHGSLVYAPNGDPVGTWSF